MYVKYLISKSCWRSDSVQVDNDCIIVSCGGSVDIGDIKGSFTQTVTLRRDTEMEDTRYYCILSECKNYEY